MLYSMGMCQTCYLTDYHKRKVTSAIKAEEEMAAENNLAYIHENEEEDSFESSSA
jgi:hypothetical protein